MTCSALKKIYRQILLTGSTDPDVQAKFPTENFYFILLILSRDELHKRLLQRQSTHFMNPSLLNSQLETLELPKSQADEPHTYTVKCDGLSVDEVAHQIQKLIMQ